MRRAAPFLMLCTASLAACGGDGAQMAPDAPGGNTIDGQSIDATTIDGTPAATFPASISFDQVECGGYRTTYVQWANDGTAPLTFSASSPDPRFSFDPPSGVTLPGAGGIIVALARAPAETSTAGVDVVAPLILATGAIIDNWIRRLLREMTMRKIRGAPWRAPR